MLWELTILSSDCVREDSRCTERQLKRYLIFNSKYFLLENEYMYICIYVHIYIYIHSLTAQWFWWLLEFQKFIPSCLRKKIPSHLNLLRIPSLAGYRSPNLQDVVKGWDGPREEGVLNQGSWFQRGFGTLRYCLYLARCTLLSSFFGLCKKYLGRGQGTPELLPPVNCGFS